MCANCKILKEFSVVELSWYDNDVLGVSHKVFNAAVWSRDIFQPCSTPTHSHTQMPGRRQSIFQERVFSVHCTSTDSRIESSQVRELDRDRVQHTLLCRLIVYSRDTTSAMAERPFFPALTLDISGGC